MFTTWEQINDWIKDNQFDHWVFSTNRPTDEEKVIKIVDSDYYAGDYDDKLAMTRKYLESNGGHYYGVAWRKPQVKNGGTYCEVRLEQTMPASGIGNMMQPQFDEAAMRKRITEEIKTQMALERFEQERKDFEREKREFQKEKEGVWGLAIKYLSPVAAAALGGRGGLRDVAGLDAEEPVVTEPVQPLHTTEEPVAEAEKQIEQSPFTDEEADKLFELLARFKKVEPQYLELLEAVVTMAENGDTTYTMAKGVLIK